MQLFVIIFADMSNIEELNFKQYVPITETSMPVSLMKEIASKRNITLKDVKTIVAYNIMTFNQLSYITGVSESQLRNATVPSIKRSGEESVKLTLCNPFPDNSKGKLFVLVDTKCIDYITRNLREVNQPI